MINTDKHAPEATLPPVQGAAGSLDDFPSAHDDWEFELDLMGTDASIEALERHLAKAPDPQSATVQFLKGFIASHETR